MGEAASHSQALVEFPLFGKTAQVIIALDDGGDFTPDAACDALDIDRATFDDRKGSCGQPVSEPGLYELTWEYREALFDLIEFGTMNPHRQSQRPKGPLGLDAFSRTDVIGICLTFVFLIIVFWLS